MDIKSHFGPALLIHRRISVSSPTAIRQQTSFLFQGLLLRRSRTEELRNGRARAVFWIGGLIVICASLVIAYSRAGILIFFIGTGFWAVASAWFSRSSKYLAITLSAVIVLLAAFFMFGGATLKRFQLPVGARYPDFRVPYSNRRPSPFRTGSLAGCWNGQFRSVVPSFSERIAPAGLCITS